MEISTWAQATKSVCESHANAEGLGSRTPWCDIERSEDSETIVRTLHETAYKHGPLVDVRFDCAADPTSDAVGFGGPSNKR